MHGTLIGMRCCSCGGLLWTGVFVDLHGRTCLMLMVRCAEIRRDLAWIVQIPRERARTLYLHPYNLSNRRDTARLMS